MKFQIRDLLPEYVLELLPNAQMRAVADAIAADPALRGKADQLSVALTTLVDHLPPMPPSAEVRVRLMSTIATVERWGPFLAPMARIANLTLEKMGAVVARIDDATFWVAGLPGIQLAHFDAGPALATADAGFIRFEPGAAFPRHRHLVGREITLVLQGTLRDGDRQYPPGSVIEHEKDSVHICGATADQAALIMVIHHGIEPVFGPD